MAQKSWITIFGNRKKGQEWGIKPAYFNLRKYSHKKENIGNMEDPFPAWLKFLKRFTGSQRKTAFSALMFLMFSLRAYRLRRSFLPGRIEP